MTVGHVNLKLRSPKVDTSVFLLGLDCDGLVIPRKAVEMGGCAVLFLFLKCLLLHL